MDRIEDVATDYRNWGPVEFPAEAGEPGPAFLVDRKGAIQSRNHAAERLTGFSPCRLSDLLHPDDAPSVMVALAAADAESVVEARLSSPAGLFPCRWRITAMGEHLLALAEPSLPRGAGGALWRRPQLADAVFNSANAVMLLLDGEGRIHGFNPSAERLSGFPAEEMIGRPVWEALIAPEHADDVRDCIASAPVDSSWQRDVVWKTRDGGRRTLSCSVAPVPGPGYLVATGIDVTECFAVERQLADAEERYRRVVELSFDLEVIQCDGRIAAMNQRGAQFLGAESPDVFIGQPITELFVPEFREVALERIRLAAEFWQPTPLVERRLLRRDGSSVVVEAAAIPITYQGRPATHAVFRDISQRKQNEDELHRYRESLEERVTQRTTELLALNRELESFSHSVSHDLRAPLRAINGFVGALMEDFGEQFNGEASRYLARIAANTERMADIIDNLMTLSKVARHPMQSHPVDLAELARSVVEELRAGEPGRDVEVHIGAGMETVGDPSLLRMVVQNLIGNAWKYTSRKASPRIEFSAEQDEAGRPLFCVSDNGVGFNMNHADVLFGAFNRLHSPQEFEGSGIGLATVKRIIQRHGGEVWAEGSEGEGARFYFRLPHAAPAEGSRIPLSSG